MIRKWDPDAGIAHTLSEAPVPYEPVSIERPAGTLKPSSILERKQPNGRAFRTTGHEAHSAGG